MSKTPGMAVSGSRGSSTVIRGPGTFLLFHCPPCGPRWLPQLQTSSQHPWQEEGRCGMDRWLLWKAPTWLWLSHGTWHRDRHSVEGLPCARDCPQHVTKHLTYSTHSPCGTDTGVLVLRSSYLRLERLQAPDPMIGRTRTQNQVPLTPKVVRQKAQ